MGTESAASRTHIVLVPGFAGFDSLGQLPYYAEVTPMFHRWAHGAGSAAHPVLHYFDNLPTAAVATRSDSLCDWLVKRIARGELQERDRVALVGHSTGGLDIRQLVWDLGHRDPTEEIPVDGAMGEGYPVTVSEVLGHVKRLVFLSVPQRGTNLADWVRAHHLLRDGFVNAVRGAVAARDFSSLADSAEDWVTAHAPCFRRSQVRLAVLDALTEMDVGPGDAPSRVASAQEAWAEIELWIRQIWWDFAAIDDLAVEPDGKRTTPARFDERARYDETKFWADKDIRTRSYATVGRRPFAYGHGARAPMWKLLDRHTWTAELASEGGDAKMDAMYRLSYRACAGGPFVIPGGDATAKATSFPGGGPREIEPWDNDGIVNTASMLWPDEERTRLVDADHGDIIGHFRQLHAPPGSGRVFHTYDLLGSVSGFDQDVFEQVWEDVFAFCAS